MRLCFHELGTELITSASTHANLSTDDFTAILERARAAGVRSQLLTGDSLKGSRDVLVLSKQHGEWDTGHVVRARSSRWAISTNAASQSSSDGLFTTAGVHPCRANEPETYPGGPSAYFKELSDLISSNKGGKGKVRAVGETGLDYDRLFLCPKEVQLRHFPPQLELASEHDLPLFLHSRAAHDDMVRLIKAHDKPLRGVVHSHSGSLQEALDMIELGFFIGIKYVRLLLRDDSRADECPSQWVRATMRAKTTWSEPPNDSFSLPCLAVARSRLPRTLSASDSFHWISSWSNPTAPGAR